MNVYIWQIQLTKTSKLLTVVLDRVNLVFVRVLRCFRLFPLWMQKLVTRTHSHWEERPCEHILNRISKGTSRSSPHLPK